MYKPGRHHRFTYLFFSISLACLAIFTGCRIIDSNWDDDNTELAISGGLASTTRNLLWQKELLTVQQAIAEAQKSNPTISWVAADNPVLRNFTTEDMRKLTGDQGLNELPQGFTGLVPPALVRQVDLPAGQTPSPDELFSMSDLSTTGLPSSARAASQRAAFALPPSISWRNKDGHNWLTPVRSQSSYNTCSIFSAVGALESFMKISRGDPDWAPDLSEAYAWYYGTARFNGNNPLPKNVDGWNTAFAAAFMLQTFGGIPLENVAPYESHMENYDLFSVASVPDEKYAANGIFVFKGVAALKMALQKGPVVGSMIVDKFFQTYSKGIYAKLDDPENKVIGNHAIIFVGYNDTENYWECKNSWGNSWGEEGYFRIRQGDPNLVLVRNNYLLSVPVAITGRSPASGEIVASDTTVRVDFGEALLDTTVNSDTFSLVDAETRQGIPGNITLSNNDRRINFEPAQALPMGRVFICTVSTGVRSRDGDTIAQKEVWAFTTEGAPDLPPLALWVSTPELVSGENFARFQVAGHGIVALRYSLDQEPFGPDLSASNPIIISNLTEGEHTLRLIGSKAGGIWQSEDNATIWTWTVASQIGRAVVISAPAPVSIDINLTFSWVSEGDVAATRTALSDSVIWSPEILPDQNGIFIKEKINALETGTYTFRIIAKNAAGIWQPPASATVHRWYVNPALGLPLTITGLPSSQSRATQYSLTISGENVTGYQYTHNGRVLSLIKRLDEPLILSGLAAGTHTLKVRAIDNLGMVQAITYASSYTWEILPPLVEFASKPAAITDDHTARFVFEGESVVEVRYRLDGAPFSAAIPATQPLILEDLADGEHSLEVIGRNSAGDWQDEQEITRWTWHVSPRSIMRQWGTTGWENPEDITTDAFGNIYLVGLTEAALEGNSSAGGYDAFLTKVGTDGQRLWTRQFGSEFYDKATGVTVAPDGDILVVGKTNGTLPGQTHGGDYDLLLARYAPDGTQRWLRQHGLENSEEGEKVAVDSTGVIHVAGTSYEGSGQVGMLLMRFDAAGEQIFRESIAVGLTTASKGLAVDEQGNTILTGGINSTYRGQIPLGGSDCAVIKVMANGDPGWVKFFGTSSDDRGNDVAIDAAGNIYVTGDTTGNFDGLFSFGALDAFLIKLDADGALIWAKQFGSAQNDTCCDLLLDAAGAPFVTGTVEGNLPGQASLGGLDLFVTSWDNSGTLIWTGIYGTASSDGNPRLARDGVHPFTLVGSTNGFLTGFANAGSEDLIMLRIDEQGTVR